MANTLYTVVAKIVTISQSISLGYTKSRRVNRSDYTDSKSVQPGATPGLSAINGS